MRRTLLMAAAICAALCADATAADLTILVATKGSTAEAAADKAADGKTVLSERKLFKALGAAAAHLASCGGCTVTIKVAAGAQAAKGNSGQWVVPEVIAPTSTLRILGGWDDSFKKRSPFTTPTILVTVGPRTGPVIKFEGTKHALKELMLSGFTIDVSPGNKYGDGGTLLKGSSATWPILAFGYLTTDRLVVADNVLMNGAHSVASPLVRAASGQAEVIVRNNLFLNNVFCWQVKSAGGKFTLKRYVVEGNSFIMSWPFNPDRYTSNPGALEIGNKQTAALIEIRGNLFAYNIGGAIFPQWDDTKGPKMAIQDNLFWENGDLFEAKTPGEGAVVGKFGGAGVYGVYTPETVEEDFSWTASGNVVVDPELSLPYLKAGAGNGGGAAAPQSESDDPEDFFGVPSDDIEVKDEVKPEEMTEKGKITAYAPVMPFNVDKLPFPAATKAKKYGADPSRVKTP